MGQSARRQRRRVGHAGRSRSYMYGRIGSISLGPIDNHGHKDPRGGGGSVSILNQNRPSNPAPLITETHASWPTHPTKGGGRDR